MADSTSRQEIELLQGLVADTLEVSADASLESGIDAQVAAKASSTDGTSDAKSHLKIAEGLKTSNLDVGGSATVDVENLLEVSADATGVTGDGSARSEVERTTALEADTIEVDGSNRIDGNVNTQLQAESATTGGDSKASANLVESIGVDVSTSAAEGELNLAGAANNTLSSTAEVTNATADTKPEDGASASNTVTTTRGIRLDDVAAGDNANINAAVSTSSNANAAATTGSADASNSVVDVASLELTSTEPTTPAPTTTGDDTSSDVDAPEEAAGRVQNLSSDAAINAETNLSTTAQADTTTGVAIASNDVDFIDGARLGNSTVNLGGDASVTGSVVVSSNTKATNVSGGDVDASSGIKSSKGISHDNNPSAQLNVQGGGFVTGTVNNNSTVAAGSSEGNATATTGSSAGGDQFGVDLQTLIVNGAGNVTGQVANTTNATAESTAGEATSQALGANRVGLQTYNLQVGDQATVKATNSSSSTVDATSVHDDAVAMIGSEASAMRNIAVDNSVIRVGGDTTITAATNSDGDVTAQSISGTAEAISINDAIGIYQSAFESEAEFNVTSTAVNTGEITATTVGDGIDGNGVGDSDLASAKAKLKAEAINLENRANDKGLDAAGNATLSATGGLQTDVSAANTDGKAIAIADLEALGLQMEDARIGGDADIQSIGLIDVSNITAETNSSGEAEATTDLSVLSLEISEALEVGGIASFATQTSAKVNVSADNIEGNAISKNNEGLGNAYSLAGMQLNGLDLESDATFTSVLLDEFNTTAKTVKGDASANTNQSLLGIGFIGEENILAGDVTVSSVMSHTSFTEASSIQGIATAEEKLTAVGVQVDALDVEGDATFSSNVVVRASSTTES